LEKSLQPHSVFGTATAINCLGFYFMATDKKSFLLYCDLIHTVDQLTNEQAGDLFKHILKYVNDQDPQTDNVITRIAFEPIKQALKRDLLKYESIRQRNSENARKRWDATAYDRIPNDTKNADNDNDNDNDSDSDNDIKDNKGDLVISKKEMKEQQAPRPAVQLEYADTFDLWFKYKQEKRQGYKKTGMEQFIKTMESKYTPEQFKKCVEYSITQNYQGVYEPKDLNKIEENTIKQPKIATL
jgi:hypothetical protein